jgi:RNA polymerase sigma factor (sigma-70 family)
MTDDLIDRWISGDTKAAEELYARYHFRVKEFVVTLGAKVVDADDLTQAAMLAGLEGLKSGRRPDRFTHWLLGIARHLHSRTKRRPIDPLTDAVDPDARGARTLAVRREMNELLDRTLQDLPEQDQEILELLHRKGFTRKRIGEELGLSHEAVHARCERIHERLRAELSRHLTTIALSASGRPPLTLESIRRLRPAFRAALTARHLDGLTDVQASAKLAVPEATLRARLRSAYDMLRCDEEADFSRARAEYKRECKERGKGDPKEKWR